MVTIAVSQIPKTRPGRRWITLGLILALLALRYLVTASRIFFASEPWVIPVYEVGTYFLVAVLLVWERQALTEYHITPLAIWIIILFRPLETLYYPILVNKTDSPMAFPRLPSLLIFIIALGLFIHFRPHLLNGKADQRQDWKWILIGGAVGLAMAIITSFPLSYQFGPFDPNNKNFALSSLLYGLIGIPQQIGYAAVSEEPVFRGFLWGYLRRNGWRDQWIWLFQAGLFVLAHLYYFNTAWISFLFLIPLSGLVLGWLAWRSRSIATSMVAHGIFNSLGSTLAYLIALFRS